MPPTLVYKRTHHGDPDGRGHFGCNGCMGWVRSWEFTNVIGIGGTGPEPIAEGISGRVSWVGIGRRPVGKEGGHPVWAFSQFRNFGKQGPFVRKCMPLVAKRMYDVNVRSTTRFDDRTREQIEAFLRTFMAYPLTKSVGGLPPAVYACQPGVCRRRCPRGRVSSGVRICRRGPN